jgi:hypothetical protein
MKTKMFGAVLALVCFVGFASATDKVEVRVVQVKEVPVQVKEVKVVKQQNVKVVKQEVVVKQAPVIVQEVTEVKQRRVGPFRAAFRAFFGVDDTVTTVKTTKVIR